MYLSSAGKAVILALDRDFREEAARIPPPFLTLPTRRNDATGALLAWVDDAVAGAMDWASDPGGPEVIQLTADQATKYQQTNQLNDEPTYIQCR